MSVKTCQLCGKPLGRRGGDGDFCSTEHRNQHRLRRGMDRLEEANKVASLMRRRDNPRPIPPDQLAPPGACKPRASADPAPFVARPLEPRFAPLQPALFHARIPKREGRLSNPLSDLSWRSGASAARPVTPATLPFVARRAVPVLETKKSTKPAAGVIRANSAPIRRHVPGVQGEARECGAVLRITRRPLSPQRKAEPLHAGAGCLEKTRQYQTLILAPVGAGAGEIKAYPGRAFAKRAPVMRTRQGTMGLQSGLPEPRLQPGARAETSDISLVSRVCAIPRTPGMPCLPQLRSTIAVSGTNSSGISPMRPRAFETAGAANPRLCSMSWETASAVLLPGLRSQSLRARFERPVNPLSLHALCDAARDHRPAYVAFAPADWPFEPAPMPLHGAFPAPGSESGRSALDVIEEHFDAGLEQWAGDIVDWKLDAAGARPAGLALFRPTLSLGDYEFEFFTRIENRAVTYAFRAANVSNYFKITIAMVESGRYELRRCAVIGGMEEPAATSPLPGVLRPGTAFTVKTRASQNDFMIWLDNELAARWTDGRLPTGGIGFMAPRDDRARVYWVRLSQVEGTNSPAATRRAVRSIQ